MRLASQTRRDKMTTTGTLCVALGILSAFSSVNGFAAGVDCTNTDAKLAYWRPIKAQMPTAALDADELALELVSCLASEDSELRDEIAYELFTHWLRNQSVGDETRTVLLSILTEQLRETEPPSVLARSFSALVLSELMRSDTQQAFMSETQRSNLLQDTTQALKREDDYRGLDDEIGWVHPIAHMGDLLWRFALHPDTTSDQAHQILDAISDKVSPTATSYHFNESDRLARVVSTLIRRKIVSDEEFETWLAQFVSPKSMERWSDAFRTSAGMAELHNTKQFLRAISDQIESDDIGEKTARQLQLLVQGFTNLI